MAGARADGARDALPPGLRARLLGGLDLRLHDGRTVSLESGRAESLLAYLLLHRDRPQPRQRLAFLLWPDSSESQAATNLRHVLHTLRRALPHADGLLDVQPRTLQWRAGAPLELDVAEFEQALADGRLEDAVATYTGNLLEGGYDDWVLAERERLSQLHVDALDRLVRRLDDDGRYADAIRYAEQLVRADPVREESYRRLLLLHEARGDRAQALRTYHACAVVLQRELGVEPSPATRAAYEALLPTSPRAAGPQRASASPSRAPLVGRVAERRRLSESWRMAANGDARLVLVTGEPGVGKTRLVEELRAWCAQHGAVCADARAYPVAGAMPYGLVVAWLRAEPVAARLPRLDRATLTELARLLPELLVDRPDLDRPQPLPEGEQRLRLFRAVTRALLGAGGPLLLVADDLQWSDGETLEVVHHLLRAEPGARLLVVATARTEDLDARHPVTRLRAALQSVGQADEIGLDRLSREETVALAEQLTGRRLPAPEAGQLYADSEGNPLFVVEAVRAGGYDGGTRGWPVSPKVRAVIATRLAQLSEPAARLAGVAATIGREFGTDVLADASGADDDTLVRGLDELWRRGLVRAHGPTSYDFSHGRIREAAYLALSPAQARQHHLRVAQALERAHEDDADAVSGQVAAHYDSAGAVREAVGWYARAGAAAQRLHANAEAVRLLERGLALTHELPAGAGRDRLELDLLTALPASLLAVEGFLSERVAGLHERALELAHGLGIEPAAPLVRSLALAALSRGTFQAARPLGLELRDRAERDGDEVLWVESAYVLGVAAFWQGRLREARREFAAAVARSRPEHRAEHALRFGQATELFCRLRLAYTSWLLGRDGEARQQRDAALVLAEETRHAFSRVSTTAWAALLGLDQHDDTPARRHVATLSSAFPEELARPTLLLSEALAGYVDVLDGAGPDGVARVRRALDDARTGEPAAPGLLAMHRRILVEAHARAGDAHGGLAAVDEALAAGGGTELWEAELRRLRAKFLATVGRRPADAEHELRRALRVAERQGARAFAARIRHDLDRVPDAGSVPVEAR